MITRFPRHVILIIACLGLFPGLLISHISLASQDDISLLEKRTVFERLKGNLTSPLINRIQKIPDDFLITIQDNDRSIGIENSENYVAREISDEQLNLFNTYIDLLPKAHQSAFWSKLLAVYFIDNFSGAGMTEWVVGHDGSTYYYLILNSSLLDVTMDDWLSYKDDSQFDQSASSPTVQVKTQTKFKALMYGLLHEGAHIVDYELGVTPYVDPQHRRFKGRTQGGSDFTDSIWISGTQPVKRFDLKHRKEINTYGIFPKRGLISRKELPDMFASLAKSPFVSFYSSTSWNEDLADFITYFHIEKHLGGVVSVELHGTGELLDMYAPLHTSFTSQREKSVRMFYE